MLDFSLVRETLRERDLMLTTLAPHLVTPVPLLYPWPAKPTTPDASQPGNRPGRVAATSAASTTS